jgi:hypothetical protein
MGECLSEIQAHYETEKIRGAAYRRPGWLEWLENEQIKPDFAKRMIRIYNRFGGVRGLADASAHVLEFLSRETVPEAGRIEAVERIRGGEKVGLGKAKEIVRPHRPRPAEARKIARENDRPVTASDGNIYFGATKQEAADADARREQTYAVLGAIENLASVDASPVEWLEAANSWDLWQPHELHQLTTACKWLNHLVAEVEG